MKAEELLKQLRFGNIIEFKGHITAIDCSLMEYLFERPDNWEGKLKPIELTEDLLLRLGFYKEHEYIVGAGICLFYKHSESKYRLSKAFKLLILDIDLKTVHQLQNLFHCLSGVELILKD